MEKRDLYYILTEKHFNIGLLREVYSSNSVSICNLADSFYLAVPFDTIEGKTPFGVVVDVEMAKQIIENNKHVYNIANSYAAQKQNKYIMPINDKLIEVFMPIKKKREVNGVSETIDLQWEQELMQKNKSR